VEIVADDVEPFRKILCRRVLRRVKIIVVHLKAMIDSFNTIVRMACRQV
ncbi:MAG: hypothetical protein IIB61_09175, partial [Planctomycetes bacterium]|nr:hypothetical protein [Planctomycetota bacterium]